MSQVMLLIGILLTATTTELSGLVVDQQGQPVAGAIVVISTAKPRVGPATTCPSCYRDCTKRTLTDAEGRFSFDGLSSSLRFSMAAGGAGFQGMVSEYYDPLRQPEIELKLQRLTDTPEVTSVTGTVVDKDGNPIAGAEIRTQRIYRTSGVIGGSDPSVTPLTLADSAGHFRLTAAEHIRSLDLRVTAAGYAPSEVTWQQASNVELKLVLGRGASIRGRLILNDAPLASVELGLVQQDRRLGNIVTPLEVSTDPQGYFQFDQLPPELDYTIYTHTGQDAEGVLPVSVITAPGDGQRADLGEIVAAPPGRLTISVRTEDGSTLPANSVVYVGRRSAWRGSTLDLPQQPAAEVQLVDVSSEVFQISLRVPGFQVVSTTPPLNVDLNQSYSVRTGADTSVAFMVRRNEDKQPAPSADSVTRNERDSLSGAIPGSNPRNAIPQAAGVTPGA